MLKWLYEEGEFSKREDFPESCYGFVYRITNLKNGKIYIGRKILQNTLNKKLTKKELSEQTGPGRKPTKKKVVKESNWLTYWGSNKPLLEDIKELGQDSFEREIIKLTFSKKELTYYELHYQCIFEVLLTNSYNSNILGKFYPKDLEV
jgi:hypothetical protein|tara:strand:+ start:5015 stop:5458 length:444 start_codon:yes stop_codon:yes gene_type:complete